MEIITALAIPMEAGKKFKKEELVDIIQTHLNTHPILKDNPRFNGLFGGRRQHHGSTDKENPPRPAANTSVPSTHANMHCQHPSQSRSAAPSTATSQPLIPSSHVNFTIPHGPSTSSRPFTPLSAPHSLPAHYYPGTIPLPHGAYYSHLDHNSVHSYNPPQYPSLNNGNPF